METDAQHVQRRLQERLVLHGHERPDGAIRGDERPVAIDGDRGIRLVSREHEIDRLARGVERGIVELSFRIHRRVSGGDQQRVALAQRDLQTLGEMQHHVPARRRAAGLDETEMARGDLGLEREIELTETAALPPFAEQRSGGAHGPRR